MDRLRVRHRQASGQAQADRARVRVRRLAKRQLAAAEHLRPGRELDVDLQADHRLEAARARRLARPGAPSDTGRSAVEADRLLERVGGVEQPVLAERRPGDLQADRQTAARCSPQGIEIAGMPASDIGTVQ